jgi:peptidoglycan/LPS O-acetylase OafA/YrhL
MYVFHTTILFMLIVAARHLGISYRPSGPLNFVLASVLTIGAAALSWHVMERRINDLKRHFPYGRLSRQPVRPLSVAAVAQGSVADG